jgi:hypothetical protein
MRLEIFAKMHGVHAGKQNDMQKDEGPATPKQSNSPSRHCSEKKNNARKGLLWGRANNQRTARARTSFQTVPGVQ